jgi:hypothetical protein
VTCKTSSLAEVEPAVEERGAEIETPAEVAVEAELVELVEQELVFSEAACKSAVSRLKNLDNGDDIHKNGFDGWFPEDDTSIAAPGTNCGDTAMGVSEPCSKYNHWVGIKTMAQKATATKAKMLGGCITRETRNSNCYISTLVCPKAMILKCDGYHPIGLSIGVTYNFGSAKVCTATCTATEE